MYTYVAIAPPILDNSVPVYPIGLFSFAHIIIPHSVTIEPIWMEKSLPSIALSSIANTNPPHINTAGFKAMCPCF